MNIRCYNPAGEPVELKIEGDRITDIQPLPKADSENLYWALPSFADSHVHPNYIA